MIISQLRTKILLSMLGVIIISIVVFTFLNLRLLKTQFTRNMMEKAGLIIGAVQLNLYEVMLGQHDQDLVHLFEWVNKDSCVLAMRISDMQGKIRYANTLSEVGTSIESGLLRNSEKKDSINQAILHSPNGDAYLSSFMLISNGESCTVCHSPNLGSLGFLNVDLSLVEVEHNIAIVQRYYIIFAAGTIFLLALTIGFIHVRYVQSSIREMTNKISEFEHGNLSIRVNIPREDELGRLARSFNLMADKFEMMNQEVEQHYQLELERAEKIATVGELAASVAHEIKNPASGIANAMQVILSEVHEDDERRPIYQEIIRQVERMNKAINDLLTYAKPSPLKLEYVDLNMTIKHSLSFTETQANSLSVEIYTEIDQDLPTILADRKQIEQVLLNLCINAIQAMPDGGTLTVRSWMEQDSQQIKISVGDTGAGISHERQGDIFKPFFTTKNKGTGLGLAISRRIMQEHHGSIQVESEPGQGATFILTFSLHGQEAM